MKHSSIISQYIRKALINAYIEKKKLGKKFIYVASSKLKVPSMVIRIDLNRKKSELYQIVYRLRISKTLDKLSSQTGIDKNKLIELALLDYINLKKPDDFLVMVKILTNRRGEINILDVALRLPHINIKNKIYKLKHSAYVDRLSSQTGIDKNKLIELALLDLLKFNKRDMGIFLHICQVIQKRIQ